MEFISHPMQPRLILHGKSLLKDFLRSSLNFKVFLLLVYLLLYPIRSRVQYMHLEAQSIAYLTMKMMILLLPALLNIQLNIRQALVIIGDITLSINVTTLQIGVIVGSQFHCLV